MGRSSIGRWRLGEQVALDPEDGKSMKSRLMIRRGKRKAMMIMMFHSWGRPVNQTETGTDTSVSTQTAQCQYPATQHTFTSTHFCLSIGSTPTVGSSRISSSGLCTMAAARETRLCCPPLGYKHTMSITHSCYISIIGFWILYIDQYSKQNTLFQKLQPFSSPDKQEVCSN